MRNLGFTPCTTQWMLILESRRLCSGARLVSSILGDEQLRAQWLTEVKGMADRIIDMRHGLQSSESKGPPLTSLQPTGLTDRYHLRLFASARGHEHPGQLEAHFQPDRYVQFHRPQGRSRRCSRRQGFDLHVSPELHSPPRAVHSNRAHIITVLAAGPVMVESRWPV